MNKSSAFFRLKCKWIKSQRRLTRHLVYVVTSFAEVKMKPLWTKELIKNIYKSSTVGTNDKYQPLSLVPPSSMVICSASSESDSSMVWLERSVNDRRFLILFIFSMAGRCGACETHTHTHTNAVNVRPGVAPKTTFHKSVGARRQQVEIADNLLLCSDRPHEWSTAPFNPILIRSTTAWAGHA